MGTTAFNTAGDGGTDRLVNNGTNPGAGDVLMITDGTDGTAAEGSDAGIPGVGRSPKTSAGPTNAGSGPNAEEETSTAIAVAERGTYIGTTLGTAGIANPFRGGFVAAAPVGVLADIAKYVPHEDGAADVIADLLAGRPGDHQEDDLADFEKVYLCDNDSALEHAVRNCRGDGDRDGARRLLEAYRKANRSRVARCFAKKSVSEVPLPLYSVDSDGELVFNPDAVFRHPIVWLALDNWPMLKRALSAGLDVNAEYNMNLLKSVDGVPLVTPTMSTCIKTSATAQVAACFKGLLDHNDIVLYQPKPGETSLITSSFGFILLAEALRPGPLGKGDMELTEHFLRHRKFDVNIISEDGSVPLHWSLVALTRRTDEDGSFKNDLNRCIGTIVVLVSGGADIDGGAADQLSPQAVALDGITSEDPAIASRYYLALAAMRGHIDLVDCSEGLELDEKIISRLLSHRRRLLVGDIALYQPKPGRTSLIASSFGRILLAEALRPGPLGKGDMELTEHFLRHRKFDVNIISEDGSVPLHWSLVALTRRTDEDGSFKNDLNRCIGTIVVLVSGGADIDGGAADQLSPQAVALDGITSEAPAIAARYYLALAAMRGDIDLVDCSEGLELDEKIISRLLSHRRRLLVGDVALYQPKPGRTSLIASSFGRILLAEALRPGPLGKGDMELTEHFLRHRKFDVNIISEDGSVPLHWSLVALTRRIDGSFENDLNRCIRIIIVLVSHGADVDGGAADQLSPQAVALDGITSEAPAIAARYYLALAAMRGDIDLVDCSEGLEKMAYGVLWLLSQRFGYLVGPLLFILRMFRNMRNFVYLFAAFGVFGTTA